VNDVFASQWHVVRTHSRREFDAQRHLSRQGFEVYLPRYQKRRSHARKVELISAPLFPCYAFVKVDPLRQQWRSIRSTIGVVELLCRDGVPVPLPDRFIADLRRSEVKGLVRIIDRVPLPMGAPVQVLDGVFAGRAGLFDGMSDDERVAVLLEFLGRETRVMLDSASIAAA